MDRTLGELFCGGGGFTAGAVAAGLRPIFGVEYDADIAQAYARNFGPHCIVSAVEDVDYSTLQTPFHLHASPSCKKASVANKERGETPEDISAAEATARAIRALQTPNFSLENVWGYREFESFKIILRALEESGYAFGFWHLNSADYGVPQTRKRLILLASKTHRPRKPVQTHAKNPPAQVDLFGSAPLLPWEGWYGAIEDLIPTLPESKFAKWQLERLPDLISESFYTVAQQFDDKKGTEAGYGCPRRSTSQPALTVTNQSASWFKAFLFNNQHEHENGGGGPKTARPDEPSMAITATVGGRMRAFIVDGKANYEGDLQITDGSEPVVTITASQTRHPFRAFPAQGTSTMEIRDESEPSACVVATVHGEAAKPRAWLSQGKVVSMTPRALARFQSIPDTYVLPDKPGLSCRIVGNAVPSLLARLMCESMSQAISRCA